ncbi:MAG TPA: amidohydrolase family protein [Pseudomonadales bacterium]|jgi:N-acyl-D-aspartate/D-glutamate deacylase
MAHDLVIRGGTIADGSGADPVPGDVAVNGTTITEVGNVEGAGRREIDARGLLVTPGFVDTHTHLDAQIGWDPMLTPVSWHGVTTALLGNCGVTFAPCHASDRDFLAGMMETVEDIPKDAILGGLPWSWEDYGGYLDALQDLNPAINVAGLVGHCAVRYYVMGERSIDDNSTAEERQRMAEVVADAVRAGAVGFSTSRFLGHYIPDGRHVPGTHADHDELVQIAAEVGKLGGLMQNVLNLGGDFEGEISLLAAEARASGQRVLFSNTAGKTQAWGDKLNARISALRAEGLDINGIAIPRGSGFVTGLQAMLVWQGPTWGQLAKQDLSGRLQAIADPEFRARLIAEAEENPLRFDTRQMFWLGDGERPDYTCDGRNSLQALADANDELPVETFLRLSRETAGKALFTIRFFNQNVDALAELISTDWCLPGLGDAGAHVSQIMDSGWATFVLSHWARDAGLYTVGEAVRRITSAPARIIGLSDRGTVAPGMRADLNVIDFDGLHEQMPEMVHDFPGGAPRFIQRASGYRATLCNGQVILENDEHTGARSGEVIRR